MKWISVRRRALALVAIFAIACAGLTAAPASAASGPAAVYVFGQSGSYTTVTSGLSSTKFASPNSDVVDNTNHRMFVADSANNRVLIFNLNADNSVPDDTADYVLGQSSFTTNTSGLTASSLSSPSGLAYDSTNNRLYVADSGNKRILVFNVSTITNGMSASYVLGQADFVSNATATTQAGISSSEGIAYSPSNKYLFATDQSNHRVLVWDTTILSNGMNAAFVIGQTSFTASASAITQSSTFGPTGVAVDPVTNQIYVVDANASRVLNYNMASLANGMNASYVLGQTLFTSASYGTTQSTFNIPRAVAAGGGRVYVSDRSNSRVMIFDASNTANGQPAIAEFGQPDYVSATFNNGGVSASSLSYPAGLTFDPGTYRLYVTDLNNNRVLAYNVMTSSVNVSVQIDSTFTFSISNQSTACNGESSFATSAGSATAVSFGHLGAVTNVSGGQALTVASNAGSGFAVYVRGTQASTNLRSLGHNWSDVAGTYASPATLGSGEVFGYTWLDSTASSSITAAGSAKFAALDATNRTIMGSTSSTSGSGCVSFDAQSAAATPAGSYSGTVIYTAVPAF